MAPNSDLRAAGGTSPIYEPAAGELQFTVRSVAAGCVLEALLAAVNINVGLRTGWATGGSILTAVLSLSIFSLIKPRRAFTALETNITQTASSAAASMTTAAGLLSAVPALGMLGHRLSFVQLQTWAFAMAYLGIFIAVALRKSMVADENLRFPEGVAVAETIVSVFSSRTEALAKSLCLGLCTVGALVYALAVHFVPSLAEPPLEWIGLGALSAYGFSLFLLPKTAAEAFSWDPESACPFLPVSRELGIPGPWAMSQGWASGDIANWKDGARAWLLWPGVAIMLGDSMMSLVLSWRVFRDVFASKRRTEIATTHERRPLHSRHWILGFLAASLAIGIAGEIIFSIPPAMSMLAILSATLLAVVAMRALGTMNINPVGQVGKVTQIMFAGLAPGSMTTNLAAANVTAAAAAQAAELMQDFKTGYLLRASPRHQLYAQLIGATVGALICRHRLARRLLRPEIRPGDHARPHPRSVRRQGDRLRHVHLPDGGSGDGRSRRGDCGRGWSW